MKPIHTQASQPAISTFVVRFWQEWSLEGAQWRGRIEHLQSGQSTGFQDSERMLTFMRSFGVIAENEQQCKEHD